MTGNDSRPWSTGNGKTGKDTPPGKTGTDARRATPERRDEGHDPEAEALRQFTAIGTISGPARSRKRPPEADVKRPRPDSTPETDSKCTRKSTDAPSVRPSNVDKVVRQAAEEWLASHPIKANAKTRERYRRVADRIEASGEGPEAATNPNTFQGRRAAVFLRIAEELEWWLQGGGDPAVAKLLLAEAVRLEALKWSAVKPAKPTARRSKANLSDLPAGWKAIMFEKATERMRLPLTLLEISGMRPEEIGRPTGVEVALIGSEGRWIRFRFAFEGAKTGAGHGIAAGHPTGWQRRETVVDAVGERAEWLAGAVAASGGGLLFREDADHVKDNVRSLAKRLWPRRKAETRPSAYSYRHSFSAQQKATGTDAATLAVAMRAAAWSWVRLSMSSIRRMSSKAGRTRPAILAAATRARRGSAVIVDRLISLSPSRPWRQSGTRIRRWYRPPLRVRCCALGMAAAGPDGWSTSVVHSSVPGGHNSLISLEDSRIRRWRPHGDSKKAIIETLLH